MNKTTAVVGEKVMESFKSSLPIIAIVLILCFTITPVPTGLMLSFIVGSAMLVLGMGLFTMGAETSMTPIGSRIGTTLTKTRNIFLIVFVSFLLGVAITMAEPDLQVLAETVPHINSTVLILTVSAGVGIFLVICMLRIFMGIRLKWILFTAYGLVFALTFFVDPDFLSIAFDAGGVTTGPMTVPFILALGVGVANIRSDKSAEADSFGLVALCSIGPILAVLILSFFYQSQGTAAPMDINSWSMTTQITRSYISAIPEYMLETAKALAPIIVIFLIFQVISFRLKAGDFIKIFLGIIYTYVGLVLFLTGVNVGFSSLGAVIGQALSGGWTYYLLIPLAAMLGCFIISAEPAVVVLEKQIEDVSSGAIPGKTIKIGLSAAIAGATAIAMIRVITGISVMWFIIPGYAISLILSFFVPDIFTAIAFDSGGVASGPMTATFMLQLVMGVCGALGGNMLTDAFGLVAMVAMMPLISIQIVGVIYSIKSKSAQKKKTAPEVVYTDSDIIELWG